MHRTTIRSQNEIGMAAYAASNGSLWAFWMWSRWVYAEKIHLLDDPQLSAEMLTQWRNFSVHPSGVGRLRLISILRNDGEKHWQPFVQASRIRHHAPETTDGPLGLYNNPTLQVMGAMTHMDIAQYLYEKQIISSL